jgi:alanine racemase
MSPRRVATLGIGYADGYPRSLGDRGWGELRGVRVPVLGRVSMDLVVVDITDVPGEVLPGDAVTMLGGAVGLDALADAAGTIAYELLTRLGPRFQREHVHEDRRAGHAVGRGADDAG